MKISMDELMSRRLHWDDAKDLGGESFDVFPDENGSDALRMSIVDIRNQHSTPRMIQFSILFRGPASPFLSQRIYRFQHARLGEFAFLITAIAKTADTIDYEACFSHAP
jgi:hypothetical protein